MQGPFLIGGSWVLNSTAAGCTNFKNYLSNPLYMFEILPLFGKSNKVKLTARLQCVDGSSFAINLSIYPLQLAREVSATTALQTLDVSYFRPLSNASPKKNAVATSRNGIYSDNICGVAVYDAELTSSASQQTYATDLNAPVPGFYCFIPSTFNPNEVSKFSIEVYLNNNSSSSSSIRFF
jgi:hypothetical protein